MITRRSAVLALPAVLLCALARADVPPPSGALLDAAKVQPADFRLEKTKVSVVQDGARKVVRAEFPAGDGFPGFDFPTAQTGSWNLSKYAGVAVEVANKSAASAQIALRLDNPGDWQKEPFNTESITLKPGEAGTIRVTFGKSYGGNPSYALDSSKVITVKLFAIQPKGDLTIDVVSLKAFGTAPPAAPKPAASTSAVRVAGPPSQSSPPISGEILPLSDKFDIKTLKPTQATPTLTTHLGGPALKVDFIPGANSYPNVHFPIPKDGWNLSAFGGVAVELTNAGDKEVRVGLRVDNEGEWKDSPWNTATTHLKPGETKTLRATFGKDGEGPGFALDPARVSDIQVFLIDPKNPATLILRDLKGVGSPADRAVPNAFSKPSDRDTPVTPPAWLGTRPPVDGYNAAQWVRTLDENFDGDKLDEKIWSYETWWHGALDGQTQRYSRNNTKFSNGTMKFITERRPGHQNDDPKAPRRDYVTGHIVSYDKWTQLYGYFEARVKLPTARGLWPAFWMMPDRGRAAGPEGWKREDTKNGGMEIDILEHLTEWGPGRNNIAVHWDGYGSDHKSWGDTNIYFGPTKDGWHNFGLLWEPGKLTWFVDGIKKSEWKNERVGSVPAYLLLNIQMGGWATKDVDEAKFPEVMEVDYVRAWQLKERVK